MAERVPDILPLYEQSRGFDTAMRGYDRAQVDRELAQLDDQVRNVTAELDALGARNADMAAHLQLALAEVESLRGSSGSEGGRSSERQPPEVVEGQVATLVAALDNLRAETLRSQEIDEELRVFVLERINAIGRKIHIWREEGTFSQEELIAEAVGVSDYAMEMWRRVFASKLRSAALAVFIGVQAVAGFVNAVDPAAKTLTHYTRVVLKEIEAGQPNVPGIGDLGRP